MAKRRQLLPLPANDSSANILADLVSFSRTRPHDLRLRHLADRATSELERPPCPRTIHLPR